MNKETRAQSTSQRKMNTGTQKEEKMYVAKRREVMKERLKEIKRNSVYECNVTVLKAFVILNNYNWTITLETN